MDRASTRENIPTGAVIMGRTDALKHLMEKVYYHKPLQDVWALRYGSAFAGGMASLTGILMLKHFRKFLGLRKEAAISSSIASLFMPCIGSFIYHYTKVTPDILLQDSPCMICLELKATGIQAISGVVVPYALSMITASMTATKIGFSMPRVASLEFIKLSWLLANMGNGRYKLAGCLVLNILGVIVLVKEESTQVITFQRRLEARRLMDD